MLDKSIFNILNFTGNGVYQNIYELIGTDINASQFHSTYPWSSYAQPLADLFLLTSKDQNQDKTPTKNHAFKIAFHNYSPPFLTKQQKFGIQKVSSEFKHNVVYKYDHFKELLPRVLQLITKHMNIPVVLVQADMFSVTIVQAVPVTYKLGLKWKFNQININFRSVASFLQEVLYKIDPFLLTDVGKNDITNLFFNLINLRTAKTTDSLISDMFRAIFMELFIRSVRYLNITDLHEGLLILTGDYPAFIKHDPSVLLSIIDGFVLRGLWAISIDNNYRFWSTYLLNKHVKLNTTQFLQLALPQVDVFFNSLDNDLPVLKVGSLRSTKYFGVPSNILRFKLNLKQTHIFTSSNNLNYELSFPVALSVKSIIMDARARPIEYGPDPLSNKKHIGIALYKLTNYAK